MGLRNFSKRNVSRNRKQKKDFNKERKFIENRNPYLVAPAIPLERPEKVRFIKGEYIVVKCRSDPTKPISYL